MKHIFSFCAVMLASGMFLGAQSLSFDVSGGSALYEDTSAVSVSPSVSWSFPKIANAIVPEAGIKMRYATLESGTHSSEEYQVLAFARVKWFFAGPVSVIAQTGAGYASITDSTYKGTVDLNAFVVEPGAGIGYDLRSIGFSLLCSPSFDITDNGVKSCVMLEAGVRYVIPFGGADK